MTLRSLFFITTLSFSAVYSLVQEISSLEQLQKIIKDNPYTIVKFYSKTCPPCKAFAPIYTETSNYTSYASIVFVEVNASKLPGIAQIYGVRSLPSLLFFEEGNFKSIAIGKKSLEELQNIIKSQFLN